MHDPILAVLKDCTAGSDEARLSFPDVVRNLISAGVERYHADLQRAEKTYYLADGDSAVLKTRAAAGTAANDFDATGVEAAIRASQAGKISYIEFCEQILRAGCVSYIVSLAGRRAVYYGRSADIHVEHFPPAA